MDLDVLSREMEGVDPAILVLVGGALGAVAMLALIWAIVWYFVSALGYYKMFKKAGKAGWKAFVPVVRTFVRYRFAWNTKMFWVYALCFVVMQLGSREDTALLLSLLSLAAAIAVVVISLKLDIRVAKSFGKSAGVGVLLFFFPFVVSLVLGFGAAEYVGNTTVPFVDAAEEEKSETAEV